MKHEGAFREAFKTRDKFENIKCYGLLKTEFTIRNLFKPGLSQTYT